MTEPEDDELSDDSRRIAIIAGELLMAYLVDQEQDAVLRRVEELDDAGEAGEVLAAVLVHVHNIFAADPVRREQAISEALAVFTPNDLSQL